MTTPPPPETPETPDATPPPGQASAAPPPSPPPPPGPPPPRQPPATSPGPGMVEGLRFAFGFLTVLPVGRVRWDRATARLGMLCAPLVGLVLGLTAAGLSWLLLELEAGWLLTAVVTVATWAALSRGLHLDGLADTADGLGSGRPAAEALAVMRRPDIGPFGVATLVLVLLTQVAAVYELHHHGQGPALAAVVIACLTGRTALSWACRDGMPPARTEGLGRTVARGLTVGQVLALAGGACLTAFVLGAISGSPPVAGAAVAGACAVVLGLGAAEALLRHCRRRFGGITGDVLGAAAETATTVALLVLAVTA
ncbi:adenosylcobinamide-GDP ribazoletransferase [Streptomyces sp. 4N509B]|uniref:adenosylcobinamide-GDP ribazoletransferase n=1 Tax=Streptomyces sp. 4N509B TaxID=3457413 RepID=UPI003FD2DCE4